MELTGEETVSFGKHKGTRFTDLPPAYLLWLKTQPWVRGPIKKYIWDNLETIMAQNAINNGGNFNKKEYIKR